MSWRDYSIARDGAEWTSGMRISAKVRARRLLPEAAPACSRAWLAARGAARAQRARPREDRAEAYPRARRWWSSVRAGAGSTLAKPARPAFAGRCRRREAFRAEAQTHGRACRKRESNLQRLMRARRSRRLPLARLREARPHDDC